MPDNAQSGTPQGAVFLSYASQDAEAARRICEALRQAGVEVWFDQSELRGGDAWDRNIRRQIRECALFVPVISAATQSRAEGYFRLEWKLAVDRSHLLADDHPFLFPVAIGDITEATARVPDKFRDVQWTRLKLDETPSEMAGRVARLLGGSAPEPRRPGSRSPVERAAPARAWRPPAWLMWAGAVLAGLIAIIEFRPRRSPEEIARLVSMAQSIAEKADSNASTGPSAAATPQSDARQLVQRAHDLFETLDANRNDFALASDLLKRAMDEDGDDAEVWAAQSQLNIWYVMRGFEVTDERKEAARAAAERALRLDSRSFEARLAHALMGGDDVAWLRESEPARRELHGERPNDKRVLRALANAVDRQGRVDEAAALLDESAALPGGDPLALYNKSLNLLWVGRIAEAERALRASLAQGPFSGSTLMSAWYAMALHADLDRARSILAQLPLAALQEDRGCIFAYTIYECQRDQDAALACLRAVPRDWINDNWYRGPKGLLTGEAMKLAGRPEAAAVEWRAALSLVEGRLAADGNNPYLLYNRAHLLADLGEQDAAERQLSAALQLSGVDAAGKTLMSFPGITVCALVGRRTEAIRQIILRLDQPNHAINFTAAMLRLDPRWDLLRAEPAFAQLLAAEDALEKGPKWRN